MTDLHVLPDTDCTVRTTSAIDLCVITPRYLLFVGTALACGRRWGAGLALPVLSFAAPLLPMMTLQTVKQGHAGAAFGPKSAAPHVDLTLVAAMAMGYFVQLARSVDLRRTHHP